MKNTFSKIILTALLLILDYAIWEGMTTFSTVPGNSLPSNALLYFVVFNILMIFAIFSVKTKAEIEQQPVSKFNRHLNFWLVIPGLLIVVGLFVASVAAIGWTCAFSSDNSCGNSEALLLVLGAIVVAIAVVFVSVKRRESGSQNK